MRIVSWTAFFLTILGALNWLLVGVTQFDLVRWAFGRRSLPGRLTYGLVGVAGITQLAMFVVNLFRGHPAPATT